MPLALAGSLAHQAISQQIPAVHGTSFTGVPVNLPQGLAGKVGVLVIGFSQGSRDAVTVWGKRLASDFYDSPTVAYYEMPVLASVPRFMRGFVAGKIKASVSERGKPHFVPLNDHEPEWRSLVHFQAPDDAYLLLVDDHGEVRWRTQGPFTEAGYSALKLQMQKVKAGQAAGS